MVEFGLYIFTLCSLPVGIELRVQSWEKFQKSSSLFLGFVVKSIPPTYQGLLQATSILTLWQNFRPQSPCVVLALKSVIWSLWTLCANTPKVWCAEICSSVFQYGLGQWLFMTEKCFKIRLFFLVKHVKLCILSFSLCEEQKNSHSAKHELYNLTCFTKKNSQMSKHFSVINKHWPRPYLNTLEHISKHYTSGVTTCT